MLFHRCLFHASQQFEGLITRILMSLQFVRLPFGSLHGCRAPPDLYIKSHFPHALIRRLLGNVLFTNFDIRRHEVNVHLFEVLIDQNDALLARPFPIGSLNSKVL